MASRGAADRARGGIRPGKLWGGVPTDTFAPDATSELFGHRDLLATLLDAVGVDATDPRWGFEGARPLRQLFGR